jgi:transmembrane protein EpsG
MSVLAENTGYTQYSRQYLNAGTYIFTFFLILVLLAALWRMKPVLTANPDAIPYYNALFAAVIFLPLTYVDPNAMRIVQYFSVFLMLLIPEIVSSFRRKEQSILYFLIFIILVLRLIRSVPVYKFFWQ